ncbi:MAG TPA: hypothetical protein VLD63_07450 [Anaerolineales bacterium]|nr:hypothetical protein [Anaerolineales bacterium]
MTPRGEQGGRKSREILLFDLDAVLLTSEGYYESLRQAVALIASGLGFGPVRLSQSEIDLFESLDITAEWDSSALCTALLLARAWQANSQLTLPERLPLPLAAPHGLPLPDFRAFVLALADGRGRVERPLDLAYERLVAPERPLSTAQIEVLDRVLHQARDPQRSLTFHMIQELNLGSDLYSQIYARPGVLGTLGMLATRDRPTLSSSERSRLDAWRKADRHHAAIITNRPSRSPGRLFNTPEAEIGIHVAGLDGWPFISSGALGWFAERNGLPSNAYLKPSPVHILAGLRACVDGDVEDALAAAHTLVTAGETADLWVPFQGARVAVFEDAAKGMRGALAARETLAAIGVDVDLKLYGIAQSPEKSRALESLGARVFDTIQPALREALHDDNR